jgi:hypothetical protein
MREVTGSAGKYCSARSATKTNCESYRERNPKFAVDE